MEKVGIFKPPDEKSRLDAVGPLAGYPIRVKKAIPALIPFFKPIPQPIAGDWLWENDEDGQSYPVYENSRKNYLDGKRKTIYILPIEKNLNKEFLDKLKKILKAFYVGMKIKILPAIDITTMNITTRTNQTTQKIQYHGPSIMDAVKNMLPVDGYGMMCILLKDIYNKVDTDDYVYGLATKQNRIGVFSFIRFQEEFYQDLEEKRTISPERFDLLSVKVMVHEIGHLFGMKHCVFHLCIMNGCNHYEEFDSKPLYMCVICLRKLQSILEFNFLDYYETLGSVIESVGGDIGEFSKFYYDLRDAVRTAYGPHYK